MDPMLMYFGVKLIKAVLMPAKEAEVALKRPIELDPNDSSGEGYLVEYDTGYQSWSPKKAFEDSHCLCNCCGDDLLMTFGFAIEAMKKDLKIKLQKWSSDVYISIQTPDDNSKMTAPYFYVTSRFGLVPWIPTMIEMLSEEWMIVD